jgi:DNA mismatch repair ATPase MutS
VRPRLLHRERDFGLDDPLPPHAEALHRDLELRTLVDAMAGGDAFKAEVARRALLAPLDDPASIAYRQAVLRDCQAHAETVRALYDLAGAAIERPKRSSWSFLRDHPGYGVRHSREVLRMLVESFRALRRIAEDEGERFASEGFHNLFALLHEELAEARLAELERLLRELALRDGVLVSAGLGPGNKAAHRVLRARAADEPRLTAWLLRWWRRRLRRADAEFTFQLPPRDEKLARELADERDRGLERVADVLSGAIEHILAFFHALRAETAYYLGAVNLAARLDALGAPRCMPEPLERAERRRSGRDLFDPCLALNAGRRPVGNHLAADGRELVVITGANQGGKTTFLRSVGLAQLLMQCGLFVPGSEFRASVAAPIVTHFKREEDASMRRGKLDEELARMRAAVPELGPGSLLLLNESFAATNEREGSEIARQIVSALTEAGVQVFFVTHLHDFARSRLLLGDGSLFLRAQRRSDGSRTFELLPGAPEPTSHGEDLYRAIFSGAPAAATAPGETPHDTPSAATTPAATASTCRDGTARGPSEVDGPRE